MVAFADPKLREEIEKLPVSPDRLKDPFLPSDTASYVDLRDKKAVDLRRNGIGRLEKNGATVQITYEPVDYLTYKAFKRDLEEANTAKKNLAGLENPLITASLPNTTERKGTIVNPESGWKVSQGVMIDGNVIILQPASKVNDPLINFRTSQAPNLNNPLLIAEITGEYAKDKTKNPYEAARRIREAAGIKEEEALTLSA